MKVMLDTNICLYIIKRRPAEVLRHFLDYEVGDVGLSSMTVAELRYGVEKSERRKENSEALEGFLIPLEIVPFAEEAAVAYGTIRAVLERAGTPIGAMDLLIAAHAVAEGVTLVTNNTRELSRIPGLSLLDWTVA